MTISINVPEYVASFLINSFGSPIQIKRNDPLYETILFLIHYCNREYSFKQYHKKRTYDYKVDIALPECFKQKWGSISPEFEFRVCNLFKKYFKSQFMTFVTYKHEQGSMVKDAIGEFLDRFDINEDWRSYETLQRMFFRNRDSYTPRMLNIKKKFHINVSH